MGVIVDLEEAKARRIAAMERKDAYGCDPVSGMVVLTLCGRRYQLCPDAAEALATVMANAAIVARAEAERGF